MTENLHWKLNEDDEHLQEEPSSRHLLIALEDLLKRSHHTPTFISKIKYQSQSVDDLLLYQQEKIPSISNITRTELDLSGIGYDEEDNDDDDLYPQRSRSAPASPTKIYDQELAAFIDCDQQQQFSTDHFIYDIDLSDSNETSQPSNSKLAIFFEDDYSTEEINYEPTVNLIHSSLINNCLTITEENEEELEQLRRDDDEEQQQQQNLLLDIHENSPPINILLNDDNDQIDIIENENENDLSDMNNLTLINSERLSTIYESPSPQLDIDDSIYDKLIVYDIANIETSAKSAMIHPIPESSIATSLFSHQTPLASCFTEASFKPCPNLTNTLTTSRLCGTTATMITSKTDNPSSSLFTTNNEDKNELLSPVINTEIIPLSQSPSHPSPILSIGDNNNNPLPSSEPSFQHVRKMKVIQSSSSSLSDFISSTPIPILQNTTNYAATPNDVHHSLTNCSLLIDENNLPTNNNDRKRLYTRRILTNGLLLSHCASNPIPRRIHDPLYSIKQKSEEKLFSDSSSSSENLFPSDEKLLSRSEFLLQQEQNLSPQRKASSLKSISLTSPKILYPIDFDTNHLDTSWYENQSSHSHKVPTSDSGIVIDTQPTSKSSFEEDDSNGSEQFNQYEMNYRRTLTDLSLIKKNMVDIESRLNEAMRELDIEQALIEGEHELVFNEILDASENDQDKIRQLYQNFQGLIERIMTEKNSLRNEIDYTRQTLFQYEKELYELEQQYRSSDERILKKKEMIASTRKKYEDLEFQLMELETRCESELEQATEYFQNEQQFVTENAQIRQNTLHELDHQQTLVLHQASMEKDKLEREKQKLKLLFKQKKFEANELEQKLLGKDPWTNVTEINRTINQSTPINLYSSSNYTDGGISSPQMRKKDDHHEQLNERIAKVKLEQQLRERYNENLKRIELEQQLSDEIRNHDYQVKLREKNRAQERPLTRYLPIRSANFDLRAHIEGGGHLLDSPHISLTSTTCRGYLHKMGGMKFKTWNRRWFVFDRQRHSLFYYQDKTETKLRGCISFQSILEVYVDHLQSISLRSPEPREATFIVKTISRPYYLVAPTIEAMRIWVDVMITGAEGNTFAAI